MLLSRGAGRRTRENTYLESISELLAGEEEEAEPPKGADAEEAADSGLTNPPDALDNDECIIGHGPSFVKGLFEFFNCDIKLLEKLFHTVNLTITKHLCCFDDLCLNF